MKKIKPIILLLLCSICVHNIAQDSIKWMTVQQLNVAMKKQPKKIMLMYHTDWCTYCKSMKETTLLNQDVIEYINTNFYPVKFNAEYPEPVAFNNRNYVHLNPGVHKKFHQLARQYIIINKAIGFPTFVFFDENYGLPMPATRGYKSVEKLERYMRYVGDNIYIRKSFAEHESNFVSQFNKETAQNHNHGEGSCTEENVR